MCWKEEKVSEGKTKIILTTDDPVIVSIRSKDDLTAGDGAKHDVLEGKAAWATTTTCNVFDLLRRCFVPVAFIEQTDPVTFKAFRCNMLPFEVVVRREAHGSFLKRNPSLYKGYVFPDLLVEFYLKTSGKKWKNYSLEKDDPLMYIDWSVPVVDLYNPDLPNSKNEPLRPFLTLSPDEIFNFDPEEFEKLIRNMTTIARKTFLILEDAWKLQDLRLADFKVEFGLDLHDKLLLADVIDNDSWRLLKDGEYLDKQLYREGVDLGTVKNKYQYVAKLSEKFRLIGNKY